MYMLNEQIKLTTSLSCERKNKSDDQNTPRIELEFFFFESGNA